MRLTKKQKWLRLCGWIRNKFPPSKPADIRTIRPKSEKTPQGEIEEFGRHFEIRIRAMSLDSKIDALLHEWAHLRTWEGNDEDFHGDEWALMYGRIYRAYLLWNFGEELRR